MTHRTSPSYLGLRPASERASNAARGSSRKTDTRCEVLLRGALFRAGLRFRKNLASLPGKPDIVFPRAKVVVFCDGDFWHGRDWETRRQRLAAGANPKYWQAKIERNMQRDREHQLALEEMGWTVLRVWETDVLRDTERCAATIAQVVRRNAGIMARRPG